MIISSVSNFRYLVLFICHLFGDGKFHTAHILFKPNTFDYELLTHIDSICPHPIPLYLTDITKPWDWPWNQSDNPNNVLQIIFFDPKKFTKDKKHLKKGFALYRVFAFHSTDVTDMKTRTSIAKGLRQFSDSNKLILNYDTKNVSVYIDYGLTGVQREKPKPIFIVNKNTNFKRVNLFDRTFGKYEQIQLQSVAIKQHIQGNSLKDIRRKINKNLHFDSYGYISNYFNTFLNKSHINLEWDHSTSNGIVHRDLMVIPDHPKYYNEISETCALIPYNQTL